MKKFKIDPLFVNYDFQSGNYVFQMLNYDFQNVHYKLFLMISNELHFRNRMSSFHLKNEWWFLRVQKLPKNFSPRIMNRYDRPPRNGAHRGHSRLIRKGKTYTFSECPAGAHGRPTYRLVQSGPPPQLNLTRLSCTIALGRCC